MNSGCRDTVPSGSSERGFETLFLLPSIPFSPFTYPLNLQSFFLMPKIWNYLTGRDLFQGLQRWTSQRMFVSSCEKNMRWAVHLWRMLGHILGISLLALSWILGVAQSWAEQMHRWYLCRNYVQLFNNSICSFHLCHFSLSILGSWSGSSYVILAMIFLS